MNSIKQVLSILVLCTSMLFFSKNANAQCNGFNVTATQTGDGFFLNDAVAVASKTGGSGIGTFYYWYAGASKIGSGVTKNNLTSGTYCVIAYDSSNSGFCLDTFCLSITDTGSFDCNLLNSAIGEADSCFLNDIDIYSYVSGGSGSYSYLWNTGYTGAHLLNKTSGSFSVTITDNTYGCKDTLFKTVIDDTCNICDSFKNWGYINEADPCFMNDVTLTVFKSGGSNNYSYLWNSGENSKSIGNKTTGNYYVIITDNINGCKDTLFENVIDDTCNPCNNFGGYIYFQDSCQSNDLKIYSNAWGGSGNYSYLWNTGSTSSFLTNKSSGWYKVTITDNTLGCSRVDSIYVKDTVYKCCRADFYYVDNGATKDFYSINKDSMGGGSITHNWTFGNGSTGSTPFISHTYTTAGVYTVCHMITTVTGCKDTFCLTINAPGPGKNLKISHYGSAYILPINKKWLQIFYKNIGTTTETGIVEYKFPAGMSMTSSTMTPSSNSGNVLTFNVGSLTPGQGGYIYIQMNVPNSFSMGAMKCDTAIINPITGDVDPSNNSSYDCDLVVSSYDPNDKIPYPKGSGPDGNINPATKEINYLVNFQNEGNWRTYKVRVEDEIDPNFDIKTLLIGDVSHNYRLVVNGRKLTWYFDNIELTPKSQDEPKSKGYIQYSLKLNPNLPLGTQIQNTAYIFFDQNPAIITNTTKNTLKNADVTNSISNVNQDDLDFNVAIQDEKVIVTSQEKIDQIRIYNLRGKLIYSDYPKAIKVEFEKSLLANSIYVIHAEIKGSTVVKKFK